MTAPVAPAVIAASPRVRIRYKRIEDAVADFGWRRDPELTAFDGTAPIAVSFTEFLRQSEFALSFADSRKEQFALETAEGQHIGNIMFYNGDSLAGEVELGISIGEPGARGRGLGAEATVAFLRFLFTERPFSLVYLHTLDWNERARRCFLRAGFRESASVLRGDRTFIRMEVERSWWLLADSEDRFQQP